jgi:hypothetical protein
MSRSFTQFRQSDVRRFVNALRACGLVILQTEVDREGRIVVTHGPTAPAAQISELDAWKARWDARSA